MEKNLKLLVICLIVNLTASFAFADEKVEYFQVKPFLTGPSEEANLEIGLKNLYRTNSQRLNLEKQLKKTKEFQNFVYETLNKKILQNPAIKIKVEEKRLTGNFVKETKVTFESLIQRPGSHAANQVIAKIYEPAVIPRFCDYKFPATIILHHILNEVDKIEDLAKLMSSGVISKSSVIAVIQMPHYSERRNGEENFLNSDLEAFKLNMAQLILDVHLLKNYLDSRENINPKEISLSGISLGSVMGLTVGAFDQSFNSYGFLVGGTDFSNILMNRARTQPDSEVAIALANIDKDEDKMRDTLAEVDSATWLHRYRNKSLFFVSATQDNIVDFNFSVAPMVATLKSQQNEVLQQINDDTHSPSGSIFKKMKNVFLPLQDFITKDAKPLQEVCPNQNSH